MLYIGDMLELNYCLDLVISKQNPSQSSNFGSFFSPKKTLPMSRIGLFFSQRKNAGADNLLFIYNLCVAELGHTQQKLAVVTS
jgi:hypothetical protein